MQAIRVCKWGMRSGILGMRNGILGMRSGILEMRSGIRSGLLGMRSEILGMKSGIWVMRSGILGMRSWILGMRSGILGTSSPISSTNKTDRHDITEIVLKVALNTINQTIKLTSCVKKMYSEWWNMFRCQRSKWCRRIGDLCGWCVV